jgi:hypothetical protein
VRLTNRRRSTIHNYHANVTSFRKGTNWAEKFGVKRDKKTGQYIPKSKTNNEDKYVPTKIDIEEALQICCDAGYNVTKDAPKRGNCYDLDIDYHHGHTYKVGIVADMQMGSRYEQLESLWAFYDYCYKDGITDIWNAGDIADGYGMYQGHTFELFKHGERAQANYIIENYPKFDGVTTRFIGGNHDESFWKQNGADICQDIAIQRPDMEYLGYYIAVFKLGCSNIILHHGDGGVAYAQSYKPQKYAISYIENEGFQTPDILVIGHYHCSCILPHYMGMYIIQMPCFQMATPRYMGRKGLNPHIGGVILEITEKNGQVISTKTECKSYSAKEGR